MSSRAEARALGRGARSLGSRLGVLSAVEFAGLGLLLVVVPLVFDPFGRSGLLAVKVLAASLGVALLGVFLVWARAVVVPWGRIAAAAGAALVVVGCVDCGEPVVGAVLVGSSSAVERLVDVAVGGGGVRGGVLLAAAAG